MSDIRPTVKHVGTTQVSGVTQTDSTVSFRVTRVGTPVLVKVSYFPNWHANGADGPWRVTPNLMVVVPTSHDVTLSYGASSANDLGTLATLLGLVALVWLFVVPALRQMEAQDESLSIRPGDLRRRHPGPSSARSLPWGFRISFCETQRTESV